MKPTPLSRWTLPDCLNLLLVALLVCTVWGLMWHAPVDGGRGYGGDFHEFYTASWIVNYGDVGRLYDQTYFRQLQRPLCGDNNGFYSLYPPTLALALAPLARLGLPYALGIWWMLQAACFLAVGWMLWPVMTIASPWRRTALLALYCTFPLWLTVRIAHLTAVLLLVLVGGLTLHMRGRRVLAGGVLSLLALKPQFAVAICLWLLLRRDVRTGGGMLLGLLMQAVAVSSCLGPSVIADYLLNFPVIAEKARIVIFSPVYDQSFAGILGRRLWEFGFDPRHYGNLFLLTQVAAAGLAGFLLFRVIQANRQSHSRQKDIAFGPRYEYAAAVLFMLVLTPYLLVYDLTLLTVPIACLWASPNWRMGVMLYLSITLVFVFLYSWLGFSLVPFLELLVLARLATLCGVVVPVARSGETHAPQPICGRPA